MKNEISVQSYSLFEQIRQTDEYGNEYWTARKLAKALEYTDFRNFLSVISKAKETCVNSGQPLENHIVEFNEMVSIGSGAELAANLFRSTQTEEKLRRENSKGKENANKTHFDFGKKVRKTIEELGGEMPENLPAAKSIKQVEKGKNKQQLN